MNIIIISIGRLAAGQGRFYNMQDIGLSKALADRGHDVKLYNFTDGDKDRTEVVSDRFSIFYLHAKAVGFHTLHSFDFITPDADAVICYSDNQLIYRHVVRVCREKSVLLIPYVGVLGCHNRNPLVARLMDIAIPNHRIYRRQHVLAKTPGVKLMMEQAGIRRVTVAPACLDMDQVRADFKSFPKEAVREELGLPTDRQILLFIGRMIEEKRPEEMLSIFQKVRAQMPGAYLVMIGKGILLDRVEKECGQEQMKDSVRIIPQVSNKEIWKYYAAADVFVNLNRVEIFGMAMLEAMYYECPVVAQKAPGPDYIFTDRVNGYLCKSAEEIAQTVCDVFKQRPEALIRQAKQHVECDFTWNSTAEIVEKLILEQKS